MDKIAKLKDLIATAETDADKFYNKDNKAAGTRLRGTLQQIKVLATDIRKNVTDKKNASK